MSETTYTGTGRKPGHPVHETTTGVSEAEAYLLEIIGALRAAHSKAWDELAAARAEITDLEHNRKDNTALLWKVEQQQKELERLRETPKTDVTFTENFGGRAAHCWESGRQEYTDCVFSAGLVSGIEPDTIYLRLMRDEPTTLFLRPDEAQAIITILSGALWSSQIADLQEVEK